ncbi:MAG: winged helix-turn-helix transcriptional regulator [Gammaproteobacteria bacterium]|nr:winged helix-turn-helix transcriptional regulator [Gammaproteobacteria bacterium]MYD80046.1 winged helix-turn-helix transcriptional regulator [Gammaproteobacteria bacterium]
MSSWETGLREVLDSLPGVLSYQLSESEPAASSNGDCYLVSVQFAQNSHGTAERMLVIYAAERTKSRVIDELDNLTIPSLSLNSTLRQATGLARALRYASELEMSEPRSVRAKELGDIALPILLSHCLTAFTQEYSSATRVIDLPSLPVWSNMLRILDLNLIPQTEVNKRAIISRRTRTVVLRECESLGWIETLRKTSARTTVFVRLTDIGARVRQTAERRIKAIEHQWRTTNSKLYGQLHSALSQIVSGFELEYPYYITGYGPADDALTGGAFLPAEPGPPRIPARGEEWPVVPRVSPDDSNNIPMSALLSQALTGFAIEYEMENLGRLGHILSLFRYIGDDGVPLETVRSAGGITGNGRSLHERHMNIVLERGKPSDNSRTVYLSPKARRARDSYSSLVYEIESRWRKRYGADVIRDLRDSLESLSKFWPKDCPDYPNSTRWMSPWFSPYRV